METDRIKILLEAFYNGELTKKEEIILLDYFTGNSIAEELLIDKEIFLQLYDDESIEVPANLEAKLENLIDELDKKDEVKKVKRHSLVRIGSVAASIIVLITAGLYIHNQSAIEVAPIEPTNNKVLSETDKEALQDAQEALILLSSNFNKGINQLSEASANMNKANEILNKTFNRKE